MDAVSVFDVNIMPVVNLLGGPQHHRQAGLEHNAGMLKLFDKLGPDRTDTADIARHL